MCARVYVSSLLLLIVNRNSIVPSLLIFTCACPFDSDVLAPFGSFSERSCTLNTVPGASARSRDALPGATLRVGAAASLQAATTSARHMGRWRIRPPSVYETRARCSRAAGRTGVSVARQSQAIAADMHLLPWA